MVKLSEPSANKKCREVCEVVLVECLNSCPSDDYSCLRNCLRVETICIDGKFLLLDCKFSVCAFVPVNGYGLSSLNKKLDCPCQKNCPNGCSDCPNPICPYEPEKKAILMLSNIPWVSSKPMIIDMNGKISLMKYERMNCR